MDQIDPNRNNRSGASMEKKTVSRFSSSISMKGEAAGGGGGGEDDVSPEVSGVMRRKNGDVLELIGIKLEKLKFEMVENLDAHKTMVSLFTNTYFYEDRR